MQCIVKYLESPTYISSQIVDQWDADFPAITACPQSGGIKLDVLMECFLNCNVNNFTFEILKIYLYRKMVSLVSNHTIIIQACNQTNGLVTRLE